MKSIDKLIYDTLVERRSVVLPGAGTLEVKRRRAKKISDTQIIPPQNVVVFTGDEVPGDSIISLIMAEGNLGADEAVALYGTWLEGARRADGSIAIDGVGETRDGKFVVAEWLHAALNPMGDEIVAMEAEKRSSRPWLWIILALVAVLLILGGLLCWKKGVFKCGDSSKNVVETVVTTTPGAVEDSVATDAAPAAGVASGGVSAGAATSSGPRFHVIAGAFSVESNADNLIAKLKREHPELTPEKVVNPSNGYNMVSIFQMPTRREASSKMNLYWDIDLYLWIYEQK